MGKSITKGDMVKNQRENGNGESKLELEIIKEESLITPNTIIEERIHYTSCGHIVNKIFETNDEIINMNREEYIDYIEEHYPSKRMISYSSNKITLGTTKNHLCENHYIIGEESELIAIFVIGEDGERILMKVFEDYPISLLMEADQDKIRAGIVVDSEEELSEILENFIS